MDGLSRRNFLAGLGLAGAATVIPAGDASAAEPAAVRTRDVLPSDRQGFNRRWFAPALEAVYVPESTREVQACVEEALTLYGKDVKVVSGRHCYEGFVFNDETRAVIDMSGLAESGYDPERGAFFVDAGAENWNAYRALLLGYGVTLPAGSCYSVGAGGHISGGGYGLLSRLHGLTIDHVTAVDIVTWDAATASARLRTVSATSADDDERRLFWAVRGAGGGNFGVITRFWFEHLPAAPAWATVWSASWSWEDVTEAAFGQLLARYAELVEGMPNAHFTLLGLQHKAAGSIGLTLQVPSGPRSSLDAHLVRARRAIAGTRATLGIRPASQSIIHLTYLEAVQTLNGSGSNRFGKYKSSYMGRPFPSDQVAAIYSWLHRVPVGVQESDMAASLLQVDSYGGAVNEVASDATAVPQRSALMKLQFQTYWNNSSAPGRSDEGAAGAQQLAHLEWIRGMYSDVYAAYGGVPDPRRDPSGVVGGCYYNYPDVDLGTRSDGRLDEALYLYFGENFRGNALNLVDVKGRWDPQDFFHHEQSIPVV